MNALETTAVLKSSRRSFRRLTARSPEQAHGSITSWNATAVHALEIRSPVRPPTHRRARPGRMTPASRCSRMRQTVMMAELPSHQQSATLLMSCPDRRGLVHGISEFIFEHGGNILFADQHL